MNPYLRPFVHGDCAAKKTGREWDGGGLFWQLEPACCPEITLKQWVILLGQVQVVVHQAGPCNQVVCIKWASLVVQWLSLIKSPPPKQQTWVQSLILEDSLQEDMATHWSILAQEMLCLEEPGGLQSLGFQKSQT